MAYRCIQKECDLIGLELPLVPFGQGFKDMSPALDTLEAELLNARIIHSDNPVLELAAANAVVVKDPAGVGSWISPKQQTALTQS